MRFATPRAAVRVPGVMPLVSVALVPAVIVLVLACNSVHLADEAARLPSHIVARPPAAVESPVISVSLSRQGAMTLAGQAVTADARAAAWQRERAALGVLGFRPAQATVAVRAEPDTPTELVQQILEQAQQAGFTRSVLK